MSTQAPGVRSSAGLSLLADYALARVPGCRRTRVAATLLVLVACCAWVGCGSSGSGTSSDPDTGVDANDMDAGAELDTAADVDHGDGGRDICGDGLVSGLEACEPGNEVTCADAGFAFGVATCRDDCSLDTSQCNNIPVCGDGTADATADVVEQCDDGNTDDNDGCSSECLDEICGDGVVQPGEACDGDEQVPCPDGTIGLRRCGEDCTIDEPACGEGATCGDGDLDPGEACDDGNTASGDGCSATCDSEFCGDGVVQATEACDGVDLAELSCEGFGYAGETLSCLDCTLDFFDCRVARCGDGIVDAGEECDDGNRDSGDGCSRRCVAESCGDGRAHPSLGEQCDGIDVRGLTCADFGYGLSPIACTNGCVADLSGCEPVPRCGDGIVQAERNEECDDGNTESNDGCSPACREERCGDGVLQDAETCEARLRPSATCEEEGFVGGRMGCSDACSLDDSACIPSGCGNGIVEESEDCDGRALGARSCQNEGFDYGRLRCFDDCSLDTGLCRMGVVCGDGEVGGLEQCDDGNREDEDGCSADCMFEMCGDGIVQTASGEACDGASTVVWACSDNPLDPWGRRSCSSDCALEEVSCLSVTACGDGVVDVGEGCDDGNTDAGDGCSPICRSETCGDMTLQDYEACDGDLGDVTTCADVGLRGDARVACVGCRLDISSCIDTALPRCGDGNIDRGESCDDGNLDTNDECTNACREALCGDGIVDCTSEACDGGTDCADCARLGVTGRTYRWAGNGSTTFVDCQNWIPAGNPTAIDTIVFGPADSTDVDIPPATTVAAVRSEPGYRGSIVVGDGFRVNDVTLAGGTFDGSIATTVTIGQSLTSTVDATFVAPTLLQVEGSVELLGTVVPGTGEVALEPVVDRADAVFYAGPDGFFDVTIRSTAATATYCLSGLRVGRNLLIDDVGNGGNLVLDNTCGRFNSVVIDGSLRIQDGGGTTPITVGNLRLDTFGDMFVDADGVTVTGALIAHGVGTAFDVGASRTLFTTATFFLDVGAEVEWVNPIDVNGRGLSILLPFASATLTIADVDLQVADIEVGDSATLNAGSGSIEARDVIASGSATFASGDLSLLQCDTITLTDTASFTGPSRLTVRDIFDVGDGVLWNPNLGEVRAEPIDGDWLASFDRPLSFNTLELFTPGATYRFPAEAAMDVQAFRAVGTAGEPMTLRMDEADGFPGINHWKINVVGGHDLDHLIVRDSDNLGAEWLNPPNWTNDGNNIRWGSPLPQDDPNPDLWIPNGGVYALAHDPDADVTYIGGTFSYVGPATGHVFAAPFATGDDATVSFPDVAGGSVNVIEPDGIGGWFIGGTFSYVDGNAQPFLARIAPDGSFDESFRPSVDGEVVDIATTDARIVVSGGFSSVGGHATSGLASLLLDGNPDTGFAASPEPTVVYGPIATLGDNMIVGGRDGAAAVLETFNATTGAVVAGMTPVVGGASVDAIELDGSLVYIGGSFTDVDAQPRENLAVYEGSDGTVLDWAPAPDAAVDALAVASDGSLFVAGGFSAIAGEPRGGLAHIDGEAGVTAPNARAFDPDVSAIGPFRSIAIDETDTVYVAGVIPGSGGPFAAAFSLDGNAEDWAPVAGGTVRALVADGAGILLGGDFTSVGGVPRDNVAAIGADGVPTEWNPGTNGEVQAIEVSGEEVYLGGSFTQVGAEPLERFARVSQSGVVDAGFVPAVDDGEVLAIADLPDGRVAVGGSFLFVDGSLRRYHAIFRADGVISGEQLEHEDIVQDMTVGDSFLYTVGGFESAGGQVRMKIARWNLTDFLLDPDWAPVADLDAYAVDVHPSGVLVGGSFTLVNGSAHERLAMLDVTDGSVLDSFAVTSRVYDIDASAPLVIFGGNFITVSGLPHDGLAVLDSDVAVGAWSPNVEGGAVFSTALDPTTGTAYFGGDFSAINGRTHQGVARFDAIGVP